MATVRARIGWKALTAAEYQDDGYVFLSTPNIKGAAIDFQNVNYISKFRYDESPELKLQVGDVLLAKDGNTLGITNLVTDLPRAATVNGSIAVIRPFGIEPAFLRYWLESHQTQSRMAMVKDGMGVPHLFQWDINRLPVPLPPRSVQRRIADFLDDHVGRIDQIIRARSLQIELLGEYWHETRRFAIRGLDGASTPVEHGGWLGPVASNFSVRRIGSIAVVYAGAGFPVEEQGLESGDYPFVKVSDLAAASGDRGEVTVARNYVDRSVARRLGAKPAPPETIVFPKVGAALLTNRRAILGTQAVFDNNVMGLHFFGAQSRFMFHVLGDVDMALVSNPGPVPSVNESTVKDIQVPVPAWSNQVEVARRLDSAFAEIETARAGVAAAIGLLGELKRSLISAAVSGAFAVSSADGSGVPL